MNSGVPSESVGVKRLFDSRNKKFFKVGDVIADGRYWGRAEEMDMDRPAKKVKKSDSSQ